MWCSLLIVALQLVQPGAALAQSTALRSGELLELTLGAGANGEDPTRSLHYTTSGPADLVLWAEGTDVELRLFHPERGALGKQRASGDGVALLGAHLAQATSVTVQLEPLVPGRVRLALHELPLTVEGLARFEARSVELARIVQLPRDEACSALQLGLEELAGGQSPVEGWREAWLLSELGARLGLCGFDAEAASVFERASAFLTDVIPAHAGSLLDLQFNLVRARARSGRIASARSLLAEVLPRAHAARGEGDPRGLQIEQEIGRVLRQAGDLEGARNAYFAALDRGRSHLPEKHPERVRLAQNAASVSLDLKDYWRALGLQREALELLNEAENAPGEFRIAVASQMALTTRLMGIPDPDAIDELEEIASVLAVAVGPRHPDVLRLRSNLALDLVHLQCFERARVLADEVYRIRAETLGPEHPDTDVSALRLAGIVRALGFTEVGLLLARDVLGRREARFPSWSSSLLATRTTVLGCLLELDRPEEARLEVEAMARGVRAGLEASGSVSWRERRERISELRFFLGNIAIAFDRLDQGVEGSRALFALYESARAAVAAGPLRIARTPADSSARASGALDVAALAERAAQARRELAAMSSGGERSDVDWEALAEQSIVVDEVERELAEVLARSGRAPRRWIDPAALTDALPPRSAAVGIVARDLFDVQPVRGVRGAGGQSLLVHALTSEGEFLAFETAKSKDVDAAVASWRAALGEPIEGARPQPMSERAAGRLVRELALDELLRGLGPDIDTLFFCAEGALELVPLDALPLGRKRLGDRYSVRRLDSFADLLESRAASPRKPAFLGVGGTRDAAGRQQLPGSVSEARAASALFEANGASCQVLTGADATPAAIASALSRSTHALLATHGFVESAERELALGLAPLTHCGLLLEPATVGGPSTWSGAAIVATDLSDLELAILSACDTYDGFSRSGQGLFSVQTAFHAAGAQRTLTSLWRVKNDVAGLLTQRFLELYLDGRSASEALWEAKLHLRDELSLPPRLWAGWTLTGDV